MSRALSVIQLAPTGTAINVNTVLTYPSASGISVMSSSGRLPEFIIPRLVHGAKIGTPTSFEMWWEFRTASEGWMISKQQRGAGGVILGTGLDRQKIVIVAADVGTGSPSISLLPMIPEGCFIRGCFQGAGCDGSNNFVLGMFDIICIW